MTQSPQGRFPLTSWTLVEQAAGAESHASQLALSELLSRYLKVLIAHVSCRHEFSHDKAEDLVQGFITARVLEKQLLNRADRTRGRFRSFLLTSLDNFVINERRATIAQRRGGTRVRSLDAAQENSVDIGSMADDPVRAFDLIWGREVLNQAIDRMKLECEQQCRTALWELFEQRVLGPALHGQQPVEYDSIIAKHQFETPAQAFNALVTAKRMFTRAIKAVVAEYAGDQAAVERELMELMTVFSTPGARSTR